MSAEIREMLFCIWCGDTCDELLVVVDDYPGDWYDPPYRDEWEVCAKCRENLSSKDGAR